jgi:hypothetical protein
MEAVFFWPKDFTFVCPTEIAARKFYACSMRCGPTSFAPAAGKKASRSCSVWRKFGVGLGSAPTSTRTLKLANLSSGAAEAVAEEEEEVVVVRRCRSCPR